MQEATPFSDTISLLALIISFGALAWNIVRDFVLDRVKIEFFISMGHMRQIKGSPTALFAEHGVFSDEIENSKLMLTMINNSRRHLYLQKVQGKFKTVIENNKVYFSVAVAGLPKKLESYEMFSAVSDMVPSDILLENLIKNNIDSIWVEDTSNHKWYITKTNLEKLRETAFQIKKGEPQ